jgi:hypothetical protein
MYAFVIIETETSFQARIARVMLEAAGYPTIAATLGVDGRDGHVAITAAPAEAPAQYARAINMYAEHGELGVEEAIRVAGRLPALARANPHAVPVAMRDTVRNALLHTLYTAAAAEHVTVVHSEPSYSALPDPGSAVPAIVTDAPTAPVHNPEGGGFDGECQGAERYRSEDDTSRRNPEPFLRGSTTNDPNDPSDNWKPDHDMRFA